MNTISIRTCVAAIFLSTISAAAHNPVSEWKMEEHNGYRLHYQVSEPEEISTYRNIIQAGVEAVEKFIKSEFSSPFEVYIHPNRLSIDQTWQQDWNYPEFKSNVGWWPAALQAKWIYCRQGDGRMKPVSTKRGKQKIPAA